MCVRIGCLCLPVAVMATVVISTAALKVVFPSLSSTSCTAPLPSLAVYAVASHWMLTPGEEGTHTQWEVHTQHPTPGHSRSSSTICTVAEL